MHLSIFNTDNRIQYNDLFSDHCSGSKVVITRVLTWRDDSTMREWGEYLRIPWEFLAGKRERKGERYKAKMERLRDICMAVTRFPILFLLIYFVNINHWISLTNQCTLLRAIYKDVQGRLTRIIKKKGYSCVSRFTLTFKDYINFFMRH